MIANVKATEGVGENTIKKRIHAGSESIMFSVLQSTQYMYPYKSAVREIVSNCIDSVNEKNSSLKILSGELEVSDLYIEKEGDEFKESSFDASYYDPKWLSKDDTIIIEYIEMDTPTRDRIKFIDNGVGLGGSRLINMTSLGFSSKRLNIKQIGAFGLGSKSLLSTGVDYYTMTSRYNGRIYSFDIYQDHVVSTVPKFNDDGSINPIEVFKDGAGNDIEVYYQNTEMLNSVTIEAEVKRHRQQDYVNGIKSQLGFVDNIEFRTKVGQEDNYPIVSNIKNNVVYSTDNLIVGETDYFAVPQIILTPGEGSNVRLNYGPISWEDLDMKKYPGNVCFIMDINKVDVTPSRESVIYNSKTRGALKEAIELTQRTVSDMISEEIQGATCLPDHVALFESVKNNSSAVPGLSELYKIVDMSTISARYKTFRLSTAAAQLDDKKLAKDVLFTRTQKPSGYGSNRTTGDTNYNSALNRSFLASMSDKSSDTVTLFVGPVKYKHLARYVNYHRKLDYDDAINIIWMRDELYNTYKEKIDDEGLETLLEGAYALNNMSDVLILEAIRLGRSNLLLDREVDMTKMGTLEKEETERKSRSSAGLSVAERAKLESKVMGQRHYSATGAERCYYNEDTLSDSGQITYIYRTGDYFMQQMLLESDYTSLNQYKVVGFSVEPFKRFYKHPDTRLLIDNLFTIEFGVLRFTAIGNSLLSSAVRGYISDNYTSSKGNSSLLHSAYHFLNKQFTDTHIDDSQHDLYKANDTRRKKQAIRYGYLSINN